MGNTDNREAKKSQPAGSVLFAVLFVFFAAFMLSQLGEQAKFSPKGKLFAQPAFWPAVGVAGMLFFGAVHLLGCFLQTRGTEWRRGFVVAMAELGLWLRAFEYLVWFMVYVKAVPVIGYLPATLAISVLLAWRLGYRKVVTLLWAALAGLFIVLLFKSFLSVKIPGGAMYEYLPDTLRNIFIIYF